MSAWTWDARLNKWVQTPSAQVGSAPMQDFLISADGIARQVLQTSIQILLGPDATCSPSNDAFGNPVFKIRATRQLALEQIAQLKEDSKEYVKTYGYASVAALQEHDLASFPKSAYNAGGSQHSQSSGQSSPINSTPSTVSPAPSSAHPYNPNYVAKPKPDLGSPAPHPQRHNNSMHAASIPLLPDHNINRGYSQPLQHAQQSYVHPGSPIYSSYHSYSPR